MAYNKPSDYRKDQWEERALSEREFITDTSAQEILDKHLLPEIKNQSVLLISVGRGASVKGFVDMGNTVYAVDISPTLVKEANEEFGATKAVLTEKLSTLPPVDLAIAHLVLQHNHEDEIIRLINETNLKKNGVGSFQYSSLRKNSVLTPTMIEDINSGELNVYSPERMKRMVERTDKTFLENIKGNSWDNDMFSFDWNYVRFTK